MAKTEFEIFQMGMLMMRLASVLAASVLGKEPRGASEAVFDATGSGPPAPQTFFLGWTDLYRRIVGKSIHSERALVIECPVRPVRCLLLLLLLLWREN